MSLPSPRPPLTIYPYWHHGCWVFDDERTGLKEEAFVLGTSEMISRVVEAKKIPRAKEGFELSFADQPFDHDVCLSRAAAPGQEPTLATNFGQAGTWYTADVAGESMTGWLCPALLLYFQQPPERIYARASVLPAGHDPIWHISAADPRGRRFVSAT